MASYWTRKDDQSEELRTVKPWEEMIAHGDLVWPDKEGEEKDVKPADSEESA